MLSGQANQLKKDSEAFELVVLVQTTRASNRTYVIRNLGGSGFGPAEEVSLEFPGHGVKGGAVVEVAQGHT